MFEFLGKFLTEIGSAGALGLLVAAAIFYFYRRDHIVKQDHYREVSERAVSVMAGLAESNKLVAAALTKTAESSDRVSAVADRTADAYTRQIETIFQNWSGSERRRR